MVYGGDVAGGGQAHMLDRKTRSAIGIWRLAVMGWGADGLHLDNRSL
jgi:hypothetical protein